MAEIKNIFRFLKEFNEISNPVITEIKNQNWHLSISDIPSIQEIKTVFNRHEMDGLTYLIIKRPIILPCPKPPDLLSDWIKSDWSNSSINKIEVFQKVVREDFDKEGKVIYTDEIFESDIKRVDSFKEWNQNRDKWLEIALPKERGLELYNRLFRLYSDIKKESESVELMLGDGNICWNTVEMNINHPVLLQKVQLEFNAHVPEFRIFCEEKKTEIYTPMLRVISSINQKMLSDIVRDTEETEYDISDFQNTIPLYERIINVIDNQGRYVEDESENYEFATIHSAPKLFLRKRTLGFSNFIDGILEELEAKKKNDLPVFFDPMIGVYPKGNQKETLDTSWNHSGIDEDVLLTLPANTEQLRIVKYLEKYGAVLVQGPPGTGKTHTIANLIGHLLSKGNSILITSHTEKALSVVKEKVYKDKYNSDLNLQNLCISLLTSTSEKKEMDNAINEIAEKGTTLDLNLSKEKIDKLEKERKTLIKGSIRLSEELIRVRSSEYKDLIYNNSTIKPIDAAKFLNEGNGLFDYIKGSSNNDEVGLPITSQELLYLYNTNDKVNSNDENLLKGDYPDKGKLLIPKEFSELVDERNELIFKLKNNMRTNEFFTQIVASKKQELLEEGKNLLSHLEKFENFEKIIIDKTLKDPTYTILWQELIGEIESVEELYEPYRKLKFNDDFIYPENIINNESLKILKDIIETNKEKPIGMLTKKNWKELKRKVTINEKTIELRNDFVKLYEILMYEIQKNDVVKRIKKLLFGVVEIEDNLLNDFENKIRKYKDRIIFSLNWYKVQCVDYFIKIEESTVSINEKAFINKNSIFELDDVTKMLKLTVDELQYCIYKDRLHEIDTILDYQINYLSQFKGYNYYASDLYSALETYNKLRYENFYDSLIEFIKKKEMVDLREQLISKIREIAPLLAINIEKRDGIHGSNEIPENFENAWKYFQLRNQIERLDQIDPNEIRIKIEENNEKLLKNSQLLAHEKAWFNQISKQSVQQNQALQGWRDTIKQIGKGYGKNTQVFRAKARELMPLCQSAIPVWIMPLNRVVENFNPRKNKFDVIIIDEASQANILSLAALYLGKKVIIVGDDEQVSPDSFGIKTEEVNALVAQHLEGIPNNHLYNSMTSLYDMAKSSGFKPLMLTEHFRCIPEIIEFSNKLSYNGKIKPLRDGSDILIKPPLVEYRVPNGRRNDKKINESEVSHIVSIIQAMVEMEEYKNQTIGVISMLGSEQSIDIEKKLQIEIDPLVYEERLIQCGTPSQFQGDERDIIILSIVDSPNEKTGPLRLLNEDGNNDKNRKKYNVAVSRAKNQLWVVHSLNPEIDLKPEDLRLKLINYAMNPSKENNGLLSKSESPFEFEVMEYLLNLDYKVIPQFKVGAYRIDMVIQYEDRKVALECDGERYHTSENLQSDLARQAILERLGWRFIRIRGSEYYRDKKKAMNGVIKRLNEYDINPVYNFKDDNINKSGSIIEKLKKLAMKYREGEVNTAKSNNKNTADKKILDKNNEDFENIYDEKIMLSQNSDNKILSQNLTKEKKKINKKTKPMTENPISFEKQIEDTIHQLEFFDSPVEKNTVYSKPVFDFRNATSNAVVENSKTKTAKSKNATKTTIKNDKKKLQNPKFDFRNNK